MTRVCSIPFVYSTFCYYAMNGNLKVCEYTRDRHVVGYIRGGERRFLVLHHSPRFASAALSASANHFTISKMKVCLGEGCTQDMAVMTTAKTESVASAMQNGIKLSKVKAATHLTFLSPWFAPHQMSRRFGMT